MRTSIILFFGLSLLLMISSCDQDNKEKEVSKKEPKTINEDINYLTEKIMYDVCINNELLINRTKENPDWFYQNLPYPTGDNFIKDLLERVLEGEIQAYYYDPAGDYEEFEAIPLSKQSDYILENMKVYEYTMVEGENYYDTNEIEAGYEHIKKLRFLEEWYIENGQLKKEIIAIAPYFSLLDCSDKVFGGNVIFWVMADDL